jgi:ribonuclease BN (tRNA processing enzyme)
MSGIRLRLLPSSPVDPGTIQTLTSILVDDHIAIDAGSLGLGCDPEALRTVDHVFLTHSHADHVMTLPVFLETRDAGDDPGFSLYASPETLYSLERDLFNDRVWPSLERFAWSENRRWHALAPGVPVSAAGYTVTAAVMNHPVPTYGYVIEKDGIAVAVAGDTGPTRDLWELAGRTPGMAAVVVECSFPDALEDLARVTGHLTPSLLAREVEFMPPGVPVWVHHVKPRFREQVVEELGRLDPSRIRLLPPDREVRAGSPAPDAASTG